MKLRVMPVKGRIGKCRQVATVEIEVENTDFGAGRSDRTRYPYHEVEREIARAFHRYIKDHRADVVVTRGDEQSRPVAAVILVGDNEMAQLTIYPLEG